MPTAITTDASCETCGKRVEFWYTSSGPVDVGACTNCGASAVFAHVVSSTIANYGDTGMSLEQLGKLPAHEADSLLMRKLYEVKQQINALTAAANQLDSMLYERVRSRGPKADRTSDGVYEYRVHETVGKWSFNLETLAELQQHITPDEFDNAVVFVPEQVIAATRKPNKTKLNELAKRGGDIERIVDAGCSPESTSIKTEVTRKKK